MAKKANNYILIGMPGSGKSTIGVLLAKSLGYEFIDTDLVIQQREGKLLKEIIADCGNDGFKEIEEDVNASIDANEAVIAPGGSVVYCQKAMEHFKEIGEIIYLQLSYESVEKRLGDLKARGVVLKEGQTLYDLYCERVPLYEKYTDITVKLDELSIGSSLEKVLENL
ncbi:shikimate kinase [Anaerostipes sp. MSJ-23]|uniref:shikimate kinase n=1 Tax=unclassified Anaerostipes TaxID=2635253 RepID=UPI001C0F5011|nr:shikimate kinase [Anaerostipes sp. MSJ-23]MBU5459903.1 shikimate kinase [Anaerostipes sp. MSJ-23]